MYIATGTLIVLSRAHITHITRITTGAEGIIKGDGVGTKFISKRFHTHTHTHTLHHQLHLLEVCVSCA
jgi:hypothetical protein